MFQESKERVRSMALVHEKLYMSKDFASIDFVDYIKSLVGSLYRAYRVNLKKIELRIDINDVSLPVDLAVPCGLVINELVSNTLKHAFPTSYTGKAKLEISMYSKNTDEIELIVKDNGIGIPGGIDFKNGESLGLRLVAILIEDQLRGKIDLDRGDGTEFRMMFHKESQ
jgi:two-component sensor histidine kinase